MSNGWSNGFRLTDFANEAKDDEAKDDPRDLRHSKKSAAVSLARRVWPSGYVDAEPKPMEEQRALLPSVAPSAPVRMQEIDSTLEQSVEAVPYVRPTAAYTTGAIKAVLSSQHVGKIALACGFALSIFMLIMIMHLSHRVSELHRTVTLLMLVRR